MIDNNALLKYIQEKGKSTTVEEIQKITDTIDRDKITEVEKLRFSYEIWDKKSSINGVKANEIIKSRNYTVGSAYLIYIDNNLVYFQDHNPNESGYVKMTKSNAIKIAENFINEKIEENTDSIIIQQIIEEILSK